MKKLTELQHKLESLRAQLHHLETNGIEEIRVKRELADMGDDFRENEAAKGVMEQETLMYDRMARLRWEIGALRKEIILLRKT